MHAAQMQFYKHLLLCLVAIIAIFVIFASHLFLFPWFIHMPALAFLQGDTGDCPRPNDRADISLDFAVPSMLFLTETWEAISYCSIQSLAGESWMIHKRGNVHS
jgi:hypothetical protein